MKKKYGLIGYPLVHSFSKSFFNRKFESEHIDAEYINFEIADVRELKNVLRDNPDLCGLNVTLPYKTAVIPLLVPVLMGGGGIVTTFAVFAVSFALAAGAAFLLPEKRDARID